MNTFKKKQLWAIFELIQIHRNVPLQAQQSPLDHAILDVFAEEPLPSDHPFWRHPKITVFPHVAAYSEPGTAARIAAENVAAFQAGHPVRGTVDRYTGY